MTSARAFISDFLDSRRFAFLLWSAWMIYAEFTGLPRSWRWGIAWVAITCINFAWTIAETRRLRRIRQHLIAQVDELCRRANRPWN